MDILDVLTPTKQTIKTDYETLKVGLEDEICHIQIHRPDANNTINGQLVAECQQVLNVCERSAKVVILEGLPEVFCFGADFQGLAASVQSMSSTDNRAVNPSNPNNKDAGPEPLYDLWQQLAQGPFISVAHVRGKANAGGMGFVAACDVVLSETQAQYSLSELLFGLMPACVLPFLIRKMGQAKANYMTLMTQTQSAEQMHQWGLVDALAEDSQNLLRRHLLRLRRLPKTGIARYKTYLNQLDSSLSESKAKALAANREVFSDPDNLNKIVRYVQTGQFPWEGE